MTNGRGKMYSKKELIHSTDKMMTEKGKKYPKELIYSSDGMTNGKGQKYSEERMNADHWQTALTVKEAFNEGM
jgi:hypothetical protein